MKKNAILFLIGILLILLEVFFTNYIIFPVKPNILLVYIIIISLNIDKNYSIILGGILGLIYDMICGGYVGTTAVLFIVVSYFISSIEKSIFKDKVAIVCMLVYISSIFFSLINAILFSIMYTVPPILISVVKILILIPALNTVITYLAYRLFGKNIAQLKEE